MNTHGKLEVELSQTGASLKQLGGGPIMLASREHWEQFIKDVKAGKYDLPPKKESAPPS